MDIDYIIQSKLSGNGKARSFNSYRDVANTTVKQGRYLPLFSQLKDPEQWIAKLMPLYQGDMDMFGYSYTIVKTNVYATCSTYYKETICV